MAITLGTFTKQDNGTFTGTLKTLNVTAAISIVPVDKRSDNAPDFRVYAGSRYEVGAGWSQVAKTSGETYVNLKIAAPEFGPNWVRCRLVKLENPAEDGATHIALWEPRDV
ncbi:MAG TPA: DUF736 domain-containing protein [Stellaceae bacterium]|nr:DUF736 domain-containing protein [Stellaceae bacterium]